MEEKAVVDDVKLRVLRRQTMSKENHIRRIRSTAAIRMLESSPDIFTAIPSQNSNVSHHRTYFNSRPKSHQNYVPTEFWEELNSNNLKRSLAGNRIRRKSSTVPNTGNTCTFLGNIKCNLKDELEESLGEKEYLISRNPFASEDYDYSFDQDSKELLNNKELFPCVFNDSSDDSSNDSSDDSSNESSEGNEIDFRRNIKEIPDVIKNCRLCSKDNGYSFYQSLKELKKKRIYPCPFYYRFNYSSEEIDFRRNIGKTSDEEEVLKLKSALSSEDNISDTEDKLNEMYTNKAEAISSSKEGKCVSNEESVERTAQAQKNQTYSKTQIIKLKFDASFSVEIERRASKEIIIRINSQTQENETDPIVEFITHAPNTEIRVSEIGKLQITFYSKNFSPKDTPIAIRTDDISKAICTSKAISSLEERKCTSNEESFDRTAQTQKDETHSKTQITKLIFDATFSVEIEKCASKEKIIRINSERQENNSESKVKLITHASNEEDHLLEIEQLQITIDSKTISPEDTEIVELTEDIPETLSIPDCNMRSNVTPESYAEQTEYPTEIIGSLPKYKGKNARKKNKK